MKRFRGSLIAIATAMAVTACAADGQPTSAATASDSKDETSAVSHRPGLAGLETEPALSPGEAIAASPHGAEAFRPYKTGSVRHIQSGMMCPVSVSSRFMVLTSLTVTSDGPIGDDVSCQYNILGSHMAVHALRVPDMTAATFIAEAKRGLMAAVHSAESTYVRAPENTALKKIESAAFLLRVEGRSLKAIFLVTKVGDWLVEVNATYPYADPDSTPAEAVASFLTEAMASVWILPVALSVRDIVED